MNKLFISILVVLGLILAYNLIVFAFNWQPTAGIVLGVGYLLGFIYFIIKYFKIEL